MPSPRLLSVFCLIMVICLSLSYPPVTQAALQCQGGTTGGRQVAGCKVCGSGTSAYCCDTNQVRNCTCDTNSCSCTVPGGYCTQTSTPTASDCSCFYSGDSCSDNSNCGNNQVAYSVYDYCSCIKPVGCTYTTTTTTLYCPLVNTTPTPTQGSGSGPTSKPPTPKPPTPTSILPPTCTSTGPTGNPSISSSLASYSVYAYGVTNATGVIFRAWSATGGQDDIKTYTGVKQADGTTWKANIPFSAHPDMGQFYVNTWMNSNVLCGQISFTRTAIPPTPTFTLTPSPTSVPPSPTPTPQIIGKIYSVTSDDTGFSGGLCVWNGSAGTPTPAPVAVASSTIQAIKTSNGSTYTGTFTAPNNYSIGVGQAGPYQVQLTLPNPGNGYVCACPTTPGDDYHCQYSGIAANGSPNFYIKKNTLANAWWQTVGGSVYASGDIETQIPVTTCTAASSTCTSALIVDTSTNHSGFAMLGTNGNLKTTSTGETGYVTTTNGAYATGVKAGNQTYDYFARTLVQTPVDVANLAELRTKINALTGPTTGIFRYTGGGSLAIDASNPLVIPASRRVVVFAPGGLVFSNATNLPSPQLTTVPVGSFLMFITQGDMTITQALGYTDPNTVPTTTNANVTGVFVVDGRIIIQSDGDNTVADRKFIGAGTFVAWSLNNVGSAFDLQRNFANSVSATTQNSTTPAEVFVYRPDFVANFPTELKAAHFDWQEIAPKKVD